MTFTPAYGRLKDTIIDELAAGSIPSIQAVVDAAIGTVNASTSTATTQAGIATTKAAEAAVSASVIPVSIKPVLKYSRDWVDQYGHLSMGIRETGEVDIYDARCTSLSAINSPSFPGMVVGGRETLINPTPGTLVQQVDQYGHYAARVRDDGSLQVPDLRDGANRDVYTRLQTAVDNAAAALAASLVSGKSANTQVLANAVRNYGLYPAHPNRLPANNVPTITMGVSGAAFTISGGVTIARNDPAIQYLGGVPKTFNSGSGEQFIKPRGAWYGASTGYGWTYQALQFVHTGSMFELRVYGSLGNIQVIVDGVFGTASPTAVANDGGGYWLKVAFPASGTRRITLLVYGSATAGIVIEPTGSIAPATRTYPLVTMIGDSFVEGTGSATGQMEAAVLGQALGFNVALAGVGGTGLINSSGGAKTNFLDTTRLLDLTLAGVTADQAGAAVVPNMGIVFGSVNDFGMTITDYGSIAGTLEEAIQIQCLKIVDAWVAANPGKPLVFFGPTAPSGLPQIVGLNLWKIRDGIQRAAVNASSSNVWFLDRLMPEKREDIRTNTGASASIYTGTDGTHPTAEGHRWDGLDDATRLLRPLILSQLA